MPYLETGISAIRIANLPPEEVTSPGMVPGATNTGAPFEFPGYTGYSTLGASNSDGSFGSFDTVVESSSVSRDVGKEIELQVFLDRPVLQLEQEVATIRMTRKKAVEMLTAALDEIVLHSDQADELRRIRQIFSIWDPE